MITPSSLAIILQGAPFPGATFTVTPGGAALDLAIDGKTITFCEGAWYAAERLTTAAHLSFAWTPTAEQVHAEIRRVLMVLKGITGASWADTKADYVGPDLPGDDALQDRLTDEIDRRKDVEAQLAKVTAERDAALAAPAQRLALLDDLLTRLGAKRGGALEALDRLDLTIETLRGERDRLVISEDALSKIAAALAIPALEPYDDALSMVKRLVDGYAVVSQRLVGALKEVAERDATIDELRTALESIAANVGLVGSDQWAVGEIVGKVGEVAARADKVEDRLRRDDDLREQIAVAVGLDGSASLALILDTVARDRPGREISRLSGLLDVLAAPVAFGERRLSTVERAEWALRRWLAEGKECSARMAQLIDAEVYLDVLGVPAYAAVPSDDPGDASEALTVAERLRLHFGARS